MEFSNLSLQVFFFFSRCISSWIAIRYHKLSFLTQGGFCSCLGNDSRRCTKASHLQDQCFPLQKQAYNSCGTQGVHVGVFRQTESMKWSLDGWRNQPASWENGWGSIISLDRIYIGNRDLVCLWLLKRWTQHLWTIGFVEKLLQIPLSTTQYSATASQTTASEMVIKLNPHLSQTFSTKTEHINLHKEGIYCRNVWLDWFSLHVGVSNELAFGCWCSSFIVCHCSKHIQ